MEETLKIAIIGDYNFAYNSHNATNLALQHAEAMLEQPINYYWLNERECCEENLDYTENYDGVIIAPGPYRQPFYFKAIIQNLMQKNIPVLGTGECFRVMVENYFDQIGVDLKSEKVISENLISGNQFTNIQLEKFSDEFSKIYLNRPGFEFSSSRYSILPQYSELLAKDFEIGARNQFFDPEILKSKNHDFFMVTMFCPQIISTQDMPHPIFVYFVKNMRRITDLKLENQD